MLNWIAYNRNVWSFDCVQTNDWYLIELFLMFINNIYLILTKWVECLPTIWETWVQSHVESYQKLLKWYLISPCLTVSNIRYVSRVKWSNLGKGVALFPTPQCRSYWKRSLLVALDYGRQLYFFLLIYE